MQHLLYRVKVLLKLLLKVLILILILILFKVLLKVLLKLLLKVLILILILILFKVLLKLLLKVLILFKETAWGHGRGQQERPHRLRLKALCRKPSRRAGGLSPASTRATLPLCDNRAFQTGAPGRDHPYPWRGHMRAC